MRILRICKTVSLISKSIPSLHAPTNSQQTVGVIVRLEKEIFKVLTQHSKEVNVPQHAIQPRKTRAVALDAKGNSITSRDIVKVVTGPHLVSSTPVTVLAYM